MYERYPGDTNKLGASAGLSADMSKPTTEILTEKLEFPVTLRNLG